MDTRIFVMAHKQIAEIPDSNYIPMHVGKEVNGAKEDFGYLADNTGEHISGKNSNYCELTGIYWLWKNMDCDIIGICHYRRYFIKDGKLLDKQYIEKVIQEYPIIIPNSSCVKEPSVYAQYANIHNSAKDLDICREVIAGKCPEYLPAFDFYMQSILISVGNMWITRKDIFDRYCSWLFGILFEAEKRIDMSGYDDYQKRAMGFLAERLFRVWLLMQPEAVTEENVELIDASDLGKQQKSAELFLKYTRLKVYPVMQLYASGAAAGTLAQEFPCKDDFDGKIPVWVCWWQGTGQMPETVRLCKESIQRNLPQEKTALRIITLENCMEYVTFTDTIIRKFKEGKITDLHLSQLVCAELLYRYGGLWIDAAYYVAAPIPLEIFSTSVYTLRFPKAVLDAASEHRSWPADLWYAAPRNKLFQFLMECLWYYWEVEDSPIQDFLADDIITVAVEIFADVKDALEQCGFASEKVFCLDRWMGLKYTEERAGEIFKGCVFYKLNSKVHYRKENIARQQTMYGYLIGLKGDMYG